MVTEHVYPCFQRLVVSGTLHLSPFHIFPRVVKGGGCRVLLRLAPREPVYLGTHHGAVVDSTPSGGHQGFQQAAERAVMSGEIVPVCYSVCL